MGQSFLPGLVREGWNTKPQQLGGPSGPRMLADSLTRAAELSWARPRPLSPPCEVAAHFLFGLPLTCIDFPFPTYPQDRDTAPQSNWHQAQDSQFLAAERQTDKPLRVCPAVSLSRCCCWALPSSHHWPGHLQGPVQLWPGAALSRPESIPHQPPTLLSRRSASPVPSLTRHCLKPEHILPGDLPSH